MPLPLLHMASSASGTGHDGPTCSPREEGAGEGMNHRELAPRSLPRPSGRFRSSGGLASSTRDPHLHLTLPWACDRPSSVPPSPRQSSPWAMSPAVPSKPNGPAAALGGWPGSRSLCCGQRTQDVEGGPTLSLSRHGLFLALDLDLTCKDPDSKSAPTPRFRVDGHLSGTVQPAGKAREMCSDGQSRSSGRRGW